MRRRSYKRNPFKVKIKKETIYSIVALGLMAGAGAIVLSFFPQGKFLTKLSEILDNKFGVWRGMLILILLFSGLTLTGVRWKWLKINIILGLFIFWIGILGIGQSGEAGSLLWITVENYISALGALAAFFLLLVLGTCLTFNISLGELLDMITDIFKQIQKILQMIFNRKGKTVAPQFVRNAAENTNKITSTQNSAKQMIIGETLPIQSAIVKQEKTIVAQNNPAVDGQSAIWKYPPLSLLSDSLGGKVDRGDPKANAAIIE
ncbi:MAG: hypothetical protein AAB724_02085, partial [Patescibacteria group bacterium]